MSTCSQPSIYHQGILMNKPKNNLPKSLPVLMTLAIETSPIPINAVFRTQYTAPKHYLHYPSKQNSQIIHAIASFPSPEPSMPSAQQSCFGNPEDRNSIFSCVRRSFALQKPKNGASMVGHESELGGASAGSSSQELRDFVLELKI